MATSALNLNNLSVDASGRVSFSGLSSGIDFKTAVDNIIAAKSIPVDKLDNRLTENDEKITALKSLRTLMTTLQGSLSGLRGAITFQSAGDTFNTKKAFASTSRTDGVAPTAAASLIGVSVDNAAAVTDHSVEIRQIATAHKFGSDTEESQTTALGYSGSFYISGVDNSALITISATDTLLDIRDRINGANTGASATGVSANVVQLSTTSFTLVMSADKTGKTIALSESGGTVLRDIGILNSDKTFTNEYQQAQNARLTVDGLTDKDRYESDLVSSTATLTSLASSITFPASFQITVGTDTVTVSGIASTYTLSDLATAINTEIQANGVTTRSSNTQATLVTYNDGVRLVMTNTSGEAISLTDTSSLLGALGVDNDLVVERDSNTIDDLLQGITLTLFGTEEGTRIRLEIDHDLSKVKTAVQDFVSAYNDLKKFLNQNNDFDPETGQKNENATAIFRSSTVREVTQRISRTLGIGLSGESSSLAYTVLGQIGINFVDNNSLDDSDLNDTLEIDEPTLDETLLNNFDDVQKLFAFNFSSSDSRISLVGFNSSTQYQEGGYTLNLTYGASDALAGSDIDGVAFSTTIFNSLITVDSGGAKGMNLSYSGANREPSSATLTFTTGLASQLYFTVDDMLETTTGLIDSEIDGIKNDNEFIKDRVETLNFRLGLERQTLTDNFIRLEIALQRFETIRSNLDQTSRQCSPASKAKVRIN